MVHKTDYVANDGVPMVNPANIVNSNVSNKYLVLVSVDKAKDLRKYRLEEGDVVIARRGDLSKCAVINKKQQGFLCGTGSFSLHLIYILPEYFQLVYLSPYVQSILNTECVGATMNNLNQGVLGAVLFPLPPLNEQYKILLELEKHFSFIDLLESKSSNLYETIKQAKSKILDLAIHGKLVPQNPMDEPASELLKRINPKAEITSDNGHYQKLPEGWCECKLSDVCVFDNGYAFSSDNYNNCGIPLIRISNITNTGSIDLSSCVFIQDVPSNKFIVKSGDLLIAMSGATTGKMGVYLYEEDALLNQRVGNLKCTDAMLQQYRNYYMFAKSDYILKIAYGGAQPNISAKAILDIDVMLPPLKEQHRIVAKVEEIFAQLDAIEASL